jgi:hypothetical protein
VLRARFGRGCGPVVRLLNEHQLLVLTLSNRLEVLRLLMDFCYSSTYFIVSCVHLYTNGIVELILSVRFEVILVVAMYEDKCLEECDQSAW